MTGHRKWSELRDELLEESPEARASYEKAKRELDEAWEVECRYGYCIWWVSPDSNVREDLGGVGPVGCLCKAAEDAYDEAQG